MIYWQLIIWGSLLFLRAAYRKCAHGLGGSSCSLWLHFRRRRLCRERRLRASNRSACFEFSSGSPPGSSSKIMLPLSFWTMLIALNSSKLYLPYWLTSKLWRLRPANHQNFHFFNQLIIAPVTGATMSGVKKWTNQDFATFLTHSLSHQ